jgi:hypothetical protein
MMKSIYSILQFDKLTQTGLAVFSRFLETGHYFGCQQEENIHVVGSLIWTRGGDSSTDTI